VIAARRTALFYRLMRTVIDLLLGLLTHREYNGLENIPPTPPYILAINHVSALDSPALLTVCPHRVRAFAAAKHKRHPLYAPLLALMGSIWVRRGEIDRQALREALQALERGEVLGMAPEGTRSRDIHALQEGKSGVAYLATRANVPVVPVGITGTEEIIPSLLRLHRARVRVVVGQPFFLPENGRVRGQLLREYTDLVMHRIADLLPEEYQGVYSKS
jgi:1-acyl-sn-glycerol-3-phosphate acyltransferase